MRRVPCDPPTHKLPVHQSSRRQHHPMTTPRHQRHPECQWCLKKASTRLPRPWDNHTHLNLCAHRKPRRLTSGRSERGTTRDNRCPATHRTLEIQLRLKWKSSGSPTLGLQRTAEDGRIPSPGATEPRNIPYPLRLPHPRPRPDLKVNPHPSLRPHQPEPQPQEPILVTMEPRRLPVYRWNSRPPRPRLFKTSG